MPREIADWTEARILSDVIDQGAYNVKPMGNKKLVTLWLCWIPPTINQGFPNAYPHQEGSWEEG